MSDTMLAISASTSIDSEPIEFVAMNHFSPVLLLPLSRSDAPYLVSISA